MDILEAAELYVEATKDLTDEVRAQKEAWKQRLQALGVNLSKLEDELPEVDEDREHWEAEARDEGLFDCLDLPTDELISEVRRARVESLKYRNLLHQGAAASGMAHRLRMRKRKKD